jgi:hypothetical protein
MVLFTVTDQIDAPAGTVEPYKVYNIWCCDSRSEQIQYIYTATGRTQRFIIYLHRPQHGASM